MLPQRQEQQFEFSQQEVPRPLHEVPFVSDSPARSAACASAASATSAVAATAEPAVCRRPGVRATPESTCPSRPSAPSATGEPSAAGKGDASSSTGTNTAKARMLTNSADIAAVAAMSQGGPRRGSLLDAKEAVGQKT